MAPDNDDHESGGGGDRLRVVLIALAVLGTILASALLPALSIVGTADSPASSIFPQEPFRPDGTEESGAGGSGGSSTDPGFGALTPGEQTDVGGAVTGSANPYRSQDATVHFTIESSAPAYWRTAAYVNYTGAGWTSPADSAPLDGPIEAGGATGETVAYEVELEQKATALPTVYRPRSVSGVADLRVTDRLTLRGSEPFPAGATYTGLSHRPPADPAVLRTSTSTDYPSSIRTRYTNDTGVSDRLRQFTTDLTGESDTPYETAVAIESWLESNKGYSLNASHEGDDVATSFVFDMDRGYCEYFATAMTAMLRSQDVPARYVLGYSTGEQTGPNTYRVRELNAHAWVEVYFVDVGWVKFDPTPGASRLASEQSALDEQNVTASYNNTERGSPGEQFAPGTALPPDVGEEGSSGTTTDSELTVELNRSAVPGATVRAVVTRGETAAVGRTVAFNGRRVGVTDGGGQVTGTVPWTSQLRVGIQDESIDAPVPNLSPTALEQSSLSLLSPGTPPTPTRQDDSVASESDQLALLRTTTIPVMTNATVSIIGDAAPGNRVTVSAAVDGVAISNASVGLDGTEITRTNEAGRATIELPATAGTVDLRVERSPVTGERQLSFDPLSVTVDPALPIALPFSPATVRVTRGGEPVVNASVAIDGAAVGRTGVDGTAGVLVPLSDSAAVTARKFDVTARAQFASPIGNVALLLAVVLALGVVGIALRRRRGISVSGAIAHLRGLPRAIRRRLYGGLIAVATGDVSAVGRVRRVVGRRVRDLTGRAPAGSDAGRDRTGSGGSSEDGEAGTDAGQAVRRSWHRFVTLAGVPGSESRTPGEVARYAIDEAGLPREAVEDLRDAVRTVEYGGGTPSDHSDQIEGALRRIERARGDGTTDRAGQGSPRPDGGGPEQ